MSNHILRILGQEGRTTIPLPIREYMNIHGGDIISFTLQDKDTILLKRERLCDHCTGEKPSASNTAQPSAAVHTASPTIGDFLESLTVEQQKAVLIYLSNKLLGQRKPKNGKRIPV